MESRLVSPPRLDVALRGYVLLCRPPDSTLAFVGTFAGAALAGVPAAELRMVVLIAGSNALLSAASMMANDWHDVEEDRINAPERPIPSGSVPRSRAMTVSAALFVLGCVAAWAAAPAFGAASLAVTTISLAYTFSLKRVLLLGHVVTAALSGYPLWCWMVARGVGTPDYLAASAGFVLASVGREVTRTVADAPGDRLQGVRTIATRYGGDVANRMGCGMVGAGVLVALAAVLDGPARFYTAALAITGLAVLHHATVPLQTWPPAAASRRLTRITRVLTGLLAAAVGGDALAAWVGR